MHSDSFVIIYILHAYLHSRLEGCIVVGLVVPKTKE